MKTTLPTNAPVEMTPNAHERAEWRRFAAAAQAAGKDSLAAIMRQAAEYTGPMSVRDFDTLQTLYRQWLVFGTFDAQSA